MNRICTRLVLVALVLLSMPAPRVGAQQVSLRDEKVRSRVESRLFDAGLVTVRVDVREHSVTLTGTVDSLWLKNQAVQQARKVRDVKEVVSMLTVSPGESDESLAYTIAEDIWGSSYFTIFDDISVRVLDGAANLTGWVTSPDKSREFAEAASRVPGVQQVVNQIETLPASMMDDDLRYRVAAAIYNSPMFSRYASVRTAPIHVIVRRGHVTLTGLVGSEVERAAAEMLAREAFGVMGVENQVRIEED
jgi:osmotically-inducible protein OsmY